MQLVAYLCNLKKVATIGFVLGSNKVPSEGCCRGSKANMLKISKTNLGQDIFMFILIQNLYSHLFLSYRSHGYSVTAHPCYRAVGTHPTGMLSCI